VKIVFYRSNGSTPQTKSKMVKQQPIVQYRGIHFTSENASFRDICL